MRVLLNHKAGKERWKAEQIHGLFLQHGINASISLIRDTASMRAVALEAVRQKEKVIVAGGGDGTVNAVMSAVVGSNSVLGVLPLGTLNHFAKDLKVPLEIPDAVRLIAEQNVMAVDVGEVNGQKFVNNSSLGLYPAIVSERERLQHSGLRKWAALLIASLKVLRRNPRISVRLQVGQQDLLRATSFVFVGNNEYEIAGANIGTRRFVNAGHLQLCTTGAKTRSELFKLALSAVSGSLEQLDKFENFSTDELWIDSKRKHLQVSFDGEVTRMSTPLHYKILAGALQVIVPRQQLSVN